MKLSHFALFTALVAPLLIGHANAAETESQKERLFKQTVSQFIQLASQGDIAAINRQMIYPPYGIIDVYRIGVPDTFTIVPKISEEKLKEWSITQTILSVQATIRPLQEGYVEYDCDNIAWSDHGLFMSKQLHYPLPSDIQDFYMHNAGASYPPESQSQINNIEANSIRLVQTQSDFIGYFTWINQRWYLTLVDRVTTDCSS